MAPAADNIHLVYNRVGKAFSSRYLIETYEDGLRERLNQKPLLALFPAEEHLTRYFEQVPFVTDCFPASMLARKTKVMIRDLATGSKPLFLRSMDKDLPNWLAAYWRHSLGRRPALLATDFAITVGTIWFLAFFGVMVVFVLANVFSNTSDLQSVMLNWGLPTFTVIPAWISLCVILTWAKFVDHKMTISSQATRWFSMGGYTIISTLVWGLQAFSVSYMLGVDYILTKEPAVLAPDFAAFGDVLSYAIYGIASVVFVVWLGQFFRIYCDFRYTRQRAVPLAKCLSWILVLGGGVGAYWGIIQFM